MDQVRVGLVWKGFQTSAIFLTCYFNTIEFLKDILYLI